MAAYAETVREEIRRTADAMEPSERVPLETVYFGGGTPTLLPPATLAAILDTLGTALGLADDVEATLEANPGTLRPEDFRQLREAGFNRVSLGLQAIQPFLLRRLGRIHDATRFDEAVRDARAAGFRNISADLMAGIPGQTPRHMADSVDRALAAGVTHVSVYSLTLEPGTPFHTRYASRPDALPSEDQERAIYRTAMDRLAAAGLPAYEISSAARPGFRCRHNEAYWMAEGYHGFGPAAHGYRSGIRYSNPRDMDPWRDRVRQGAVRPEDDPDGVRINRDEAMDEAMWLGFRRLDGVSADTFRARFGTYPEERYGDRLRQLLRRGLLERDGAPDPAGSYRLSGLGLDLANQVFLEFV